MVYTLSLNITRAKGGTLVLSQTALISLPTTTTACLIILINTMLI